MSNQTSFFGWLATWTLVIFVLCLVACAPKTPIVVPPVDASNQTEDVELQAFLAGLHREAVQFAESGLHRGRLAMAYDANGFAEASIQSYEQASQLDGTDMRWPYLQALSVAESGQIDKALTPMDTAIRRDPTYLPSHLAKGYWLLDMGNYEQACHTFSDADVQTDDPNYSVPIQLGLAQCQLELGQVEIALQTIESISESELSSYGNLVRARVFRAAGRANAEANNAILTDSQGQQTWPDPVAGEVVAYTRGLSGESLLAQKLMEGGRAEDAISLVTSLQSRYPDESTLVELHGAALLKLDRNDDAIAVLRDGLAKFPHAHLLHFNLAVLLEETDKIEDAHRHYSQALANQIDFVPAYDAKAYLFISEGRVAEAQAMLMSSLDHRVPDTQTYSLLGVLSGGRGEWEKSVNYFAKASNLDPTNVDVLASLALGLSELGRIEEAFEAIERGRELAPENLKLQRAIETLIANGVLTAD